VVIGTRGLPVAAREMHRRLALVGNEFVRRKQNEHRKSALFCFIVMNEI
jgi:hypothetical protein